MTSSTDCIEKKAVLKAPRSRVWRAITTAEQFGAWFKVDLKPSQEFKVGAHVRAPVSYPGYEHLMWEIDIVAMEPERLFSFRWHPHAIDTKHDYSQEATTLVTFTLDETPEGTLLTVTESGFDAIPEWRRDTAFRGNADGWAQQLVNVDRYVASA